MKFVLTKPGEECPGCIKSGGGPVVGVVSTCPQCGGTGTFPGERVEIEAFQHEPGAKWQWTCAKTLDGRAHFDSLPAALLDAVKSVVGVETDSYQLRESGIDLWSWHAAPIRSGYSGAYRSEPAAVLSALDALGWTLCEAGRKVLTNTTQEKA